MFMEVIHLCSSQSLTTLNENLKKLESQDQTKKIWFNGIKLFLGIDDGRGNGGSNCRDGNGDGGSNCRDGDGGSNCRDGDGGSNCGNGCDGCSDGCDGDNGFNG